MSALARHRDTDARVHRDLVLADQNRPLERLADPLGHLRGADLARHVLAQDDELVTPEPRHRVGRTHAGLDAPSHGDQQAVSRRVPERVVHFLEPIEVEEQDYDYVTDTNCKGAFFVAQAVGRSMIARKCPGRIVNIASVAGLRVLAQLSTYCMSKAAVIQMTKALAHEWGRYNINVNAICPGYIETGINRDFWKTEGGKKVVSMLPRRRVGHPEDLDGLVLLLACEQSNFINGAVIAADDGLAAT